MKYTIIISILLLLLSCEKPFFGPDPANTPEENFEILWKTLDERYSFFEYKNVDWDSVYQAYRPRVRADMTERELWGLLTEMLDILKDGHINLRSESDIYFYPWYAGAPENFNRFFLEENYWGDFEITGSLFNTVIDSVGYVWYRSFNGPIQDEDLDYLADKFAGLKGLVIDIRNNEGGNPENGFRLARRFVDQRRHIYTTIYKNGPGRDDFTEPNPAFLEPEGKRLADKVVVLTNRTTYSAGNFFAAMMKAFPNVTLIGDRTGGGGGAPVGWELPNGWAFNFSSSITWLPDGFIIEHGVEPDIRVDWAEEDRAAGKDTILEEALRWLQ